jgi:hypothetical protein
MRPETAGVRLRFRAFDVRDVSAGKYRDPNISRLRINDDCVSPTLNSQVWKPGHRQVRSAYHLPARADAYLIRQNLYIDCSDWRKPTII